MLGKCIIFLVHFFFFTNISYYIQFDRMNRPLGGFLFSVYSILMMKYSLRRLRFLFCPASLSAHPPLMPVYHVGISCSLSAAKVIPDFYGQKAFVILSILSL